MRLVAAILVALVLVMMNMEVAVSDTSVIDITVQEALAACTGCSTCFAWQGTCEAANQPYPCGAIQRAGCPGCPIIFCNRDGSGDGGGPDGGDEHPE